jgi:hypothetical protein
MGLGNPLFQGAVAEHGRLGNICASHHPSDIDLTDTILPFNTIRYLNTDTSQRRKATQS